MTKPVYFRSAGEMWTGLASAKRASARQSDPEGALGFNRRSLLLGLIHAAAFGGLATRLYQLQVLEADAIGAQAADNRTRLIPVPAARGRILDASGRVLAANRELFRIVRIAERGGDDHDLRAILARVAPIVGLSREDQDQLLATAKRRGQTSTLTIAENVGFEQVAALQLRASDLAGVRIEPVWVRTYTPMTRREGEAMGHLIGYVGAIDKRALDDDPVLRLSQSRVGKAGVEAGMEMELRGIAGQAQIEVDARGRFVRTVRETKPLAGRDMTLTVDTKVQTQLMERLGRHDGPSAAVVLDCVTGGIVAMASTPSFDAAELSGPAARSAWQAHAANTDRPMINRAIAGQYPPGSTFKMVTALAALDAGVLTSKEKIECWGDVTVAGHTFHCWNRKGHIASDLQKALRESCDCYFYEVARRVGMEAIAVKARQLGLGQTYSLGIDPQKAGLVPTPAWKRNRSKTGWLIGETLLAGIGQGYLLATPLQLAVMTARIATGRAVTPTVIAQAPGDRAPDFAALAISGGHLEAVRRGMKAVVNEPGGTGMAADFDDGRYLIAGKTGTSQVSRASALRDPSVVLERRQRDHALFVAYAPADAPRYAVSVVMEHAGGGGQMAGPVVGDVFKLLVESEKKPVGAAATVKPPPNRPLNGNGEAL